MTWATPHHSRFLPRESQARAKTWVHLWIKSCFAAHLYLSTYTLLCFFRFINIFLACFFCVFKTTKPFYFLLCHFDWQRPLSLTSGLYFGQNIKSLLEGSLKYIYSGCCMGLYLPSLLACAMYPCKPPHSDQRLSKQFPLYHSYVPARIAYKYLCIYVISWTLRCFRILYVFGDVPKD